MWQKGILVGISALVLSGCSVPFLQGESERGSIWKSVDGGASFEPKVRIDDKQSITGSDILSFEFHPTNPEVIYIGTLQNGIFKTTDGAETWRKLHYPPAKVYGLALDPTNGERLYATGVYENTSRIYLSEDGGENWREVYTEPGPNTVITALGLSPDNPRVLMAGTSTGVVIETSDGGATWRNISVTDSPVTAVLFERGLPGMRTLLVFQKGTMVSQDGGQNWLDYTSILTNFYSPTGERHLPEWPENLVTLAQDPRDTAVLYGGASNGLFRSPDRGKTWQALNIIESSRQFPVRAIAVSPFDRQVLAYGSGSVFYETADGGRSWATTNLEIGRGMSTLAYHPNRREVLYFTLRNY